MGSNGIGDLTAKAVDRFGHGPAIRDESVGIAAETDRGAHYALPIFGFQSGRDRRRYGARGRNIETVSSQSALRRKIIAEVLDEPSAERRAWQTRTRQQNNQRDVALVSPCCFFFDFEADRPRPT
jgi:hypothetical protein